MIINYNTHLKYANITKSEEVTETVASFVMFSLRFYCLCHLKLFLDVVTLFFVLLLLFFLVGLTIGENTSPLRLLFVDELYVSVVLLLLSLLLFLFSTEGSSLIDGVALASSFSLKMLMLLLKFNPNRLYLAIRLLHFGQSWLTGLNRLRITGGQQHKLVDEKNERFENIHVKYKVNSLIRGHFCRTELFSLLVITL